MRITYLLIFTLISFQSTHSADSQSSSFDEEFEKICRDELSSEALDQRMAPRTNNWFTLTLAKNPATGIETRSQMGTKTALAAGLNKSDTASLSQQQATSPRVLLARASM